MPLDDADLKLIWDMVDAGQRAVAYTTGLTEQQFLSDRMRRDAVERCVEIVGEAARGVSPAALAQIPEVEWTIIVGTRHILAHDYGIIDQGKMWRIATAHIPVMIGRLQGVVRANPPKDGPAAPTNS
jgi:uncharacterized protein with HEPN domain